MNVTSGNLFWTTKNNIISKYPYLSEDMDCDIVIAGGGITGCIAAYYLSNAGFDTILLEKNMIGYGSSSASTAILQYEMDHELMNLANIIGIDNAVNAYKLCSNTIDELENIINKLENNCDFIRKKGLYFSSNESKYNNIKKEFYLRKALNFDIEFLSNESLKSKFSIPCKFGILSNTGNAEIDPYKFCHYLLRNSILNKKLKVYEKTNVNSFSSSKDYVTVLTDSNTIKCRKLVITSGYEAKKYIKEKIVNINRTYEVVTKPIDSFDGWFERCLIRDDNIPYVHIRTTSDNRIIIGGEDSKIYNITDEDWMAQKKYNNLLRKLVTIFPDIHNIEIEFSFNCLFGETKDGLPYIDEYPAFPNCYFSLGYGSNGILYAILGGQLLSELMAGNRRKELDLFSFSR